MDLDQPPPPYGQDRKDATFAQVTLGVYESTDISASPDFQETLTAFKDFLARQEKVTLSKDQLKILKSQGVYVLEVCAKHKRAGGDLSGVLPVITEIFEDVTKQLDLKGQWETAIRDRDEVDQLESAIEGAFEQLVTQLRKMLQGEDAESTIYKNELERARATDRKKIEELENVIRQLAAPTSNLREAVASSMAQSLKIIGDQTVGEERVDAKRTLAILAEMTGQALPPSTILDKEFVTIGTYAIHQGPSYDIFKGEYFTGEEIAIKVLRHRVDQETARRTHERFARQAVNWSALRHDSILPFYGVGVLRSPISESEFQLYMVSPYLKNQDVRRYLKQYGGTPNPARLQMALDIAKGLKYMHAGPGLAEGQGLVHSALNIFNILVKDSGRVVVGGFSHTKPVIEGHMENFTGDNSEYRYMGPEMLDEAVLTYGSDIWSWAMTSLEILTDEPPFGQKTKGTKIIQLIAAEKRPARADHPKIEEYEFSDDIWQLFEDCWKTRPQDRPAASEVAQRLKTIIQQAGRSSKPNIKSPTPPPRPGPTETEWGRKDPTVQAGSPQPRPVPQSELGKATAPVVQPSQDGKADKPLSAPPPRPRTPV